jgi:hypothetical protein
LVTVGDIAGDSTVICVDTTRSSKSRTADIILLA